LLIPQLNPPSPIAQPPDSLMGFLDIPAPLFTAINGTLGSLPLLGQLLFWAVVTAVLSMFLYWLCSAQDKVGKAKERAISARKNMAGYDGHEFGEMWPLAKESLVSSGKHFFVVLGPALLSSVPALTLIIWVAGQFSFDMPTAGTTIGVQANPVGELSVSEVDWPTSDLPTALRDASGELLVELPLPAAVPIVHKRQWWNSLMGNPNGYLSDDASVTEINFELTPINYLSFGPGWIRGWEFSYFIVLIICSLGIKVAFRIH
jgi:hypothetical protein